jgi:hypothetical protein
VSRLRLTQVTTPSNPPASTVELYAASAGTGQGTPVAIQAIDSSGNVAMLGHFSVLDYRLLRVSVLVATNASYSPANGTRAIFVELWGGGGQGGGAATSSSTASVGGGGGGGAYSASWITSMPTFPVSVAIGAGGSGGAAGATGGNGGDTTFNSATVVAKGGSGGAVMAAAATFAQQAGGAGGAAASGTGDLKISGSVGDRGIRLSGTQAWSGDGGSAALLGLDGANGVIAVTGGTAGSAAVTTSYGAGGSGAATLTTQQAGGAGAGGMARIWEFA